MELFAERAVGQAVHVQHAFQRGDVDVYKRQSQGLPVREVTFPDYASDSSALIKMYLAGQFGSKPDDVNAYACLLYTSRCV